MKNATLIIALLVIISIISGCSPKAPTQESNAPEAAINLKKAVYLIDGGTGDQSFYDSGKAGIDKLASQYGVETRTIECNFNSDKFAPAVKAAFEYADVIFSISYGYEDILKEYADKYPEKKVINIDTVVTNSKHTITSVDFYEEESAYLVGVAAALLTEDTTIPGVNPEKIIGAVGGGTGDPVLRGFMWAYEKGAKSIDPDIRVITVFTGDWEDTAKAKQATLAQFDQGADVVFNIAAAAGLGVLRGAEERGLYAIGVDSNQNDIAPGHVIVSDLKYVGDSIVKVYQSILDGTYKPGQVIDADLKYGGVGITFAASKEVLSKAQQQKVLDIEKKIMDGTLVVGRYQETQE